MRLAEQEMVEAMLRGAGELDLAPCGTCPKDQHADCVSFRDSDAWGLCRCHCHEWD